MARKKTILREHIIDGAVRILKRDGINNLTARNVANELNCSTQPIYNEFNSMDGLKEDIVKQSDDILINKVFKDSKNDASLQEVCERYVRFAGSESPLFYSMYINKHDYSSQLHMRLKEELVSVFDNDTTRNNESTEIFWSNLYPLLYGLASLIAVGEIQMEDIDVSSRVANYIEIAEKLGSK